MATRFASAGLAGLYRGLTIGCVIVDHEKSFSFDHADCDVPPVVDRYTVPLANTSTLGLPNSEAVTAISTLDMGPIVDSRVPLSCKPVKRIFRSVGCAR